MPWDIDIELVAFLLMIILLIYFFSRQNIPSMQNKLFGLILIAATFVSFFTILSSVSFSHSQFAPALIIKISTTLIFFLRGFLASLFLIYLVEISGRYKITIKKIIIIQSVYYIYLIVLLINYYSGFLYKIYESGIIEGKGIIISHLTSIFYLLACFLYTIIFIRNIKLNTYFAISAFSLGSILLIVLHLTILGDYLFTGITSSIGLMILFFSIQNPILLNDENTGCFNRKAFEITLKEQLKKKQDIYIVTVALDNFKLINQSFGIDNGTLLLKEVALFMNTLVPKYKAFRFYADSFSIIISGSENSEKIIEKITQRFNEVWRVNDIVTTLSATTTIVNCPRLATTLDEAALLIDFTLHEAKSSEKGQVFYCDETMKNKMHRLKQIELAIVRGFKNNSFELYFQPIFSLKEKRFVSAEALARLYDDELGYISPDEFISVAEANGTINNLGKMIIERVCEFLDKFNPQQYGLETISINLSVIQSLQKGFIDSLEEIMSRHNVSKNMIRFEITETYKTDSMGHFDTFLRQMNKHGFLLYLDDYGSGYSTLSYLTKLPFDTIKIDKSIIWDAQENPRSEKIIKNTITMLSQLEFNIIAEGVENTEQLEMLEKMGCNLIQGYFFCIPLSKTDFIEFIKNNNFK